MYESLEKYNSFDIDSLPNLDEVVLAALDLVAVTELTPTPLVTSQDIFLVVGSCNAEATGRILFSTSPAFFASETNYKKYLSQHPEITKVVVISASGSKHSVEIVGEVASLGLPIVLVTNNSKSEAVSAAPDASVLVFPKNKEPYTYNTSTYLSMVLAKTEEDPEAIKDYILGNLSRSILRNFQTYDSYVFILPSEFAEVAPMIRTKFDELFGPMLQGRVFTEEEIKHAKTVVQSPTELFISLGVKNDYYGLPAHRLSLDLPENADYGTVLACAYYTVGRIQSAFPPYFKQQIVKYAQTASKIFNQDIKPIVE